MNVFRLSKDGFVWDYSNHVEDIAKWVTKILMEEPDSELEITPANEREWYKWRTGE